MSKASPSIEVLRVELAGLLPSGPPLEELLRFVEQFPAIRAILEPLRRRPGTPHHRGSPRRERASAGRALREAAQALRQALERTRDPATGGLYNELEWTFDESYSERPLRHRLRQFEQDVVRLERLVTGLNRTTPGRPKHAARDILDREIVRAVYDSGQLRRPKRGHPSVLPRVRDAVYARCGYEPGLTPSSGLRAALRQFKVQDRAERGGSVTNIRAETPFEADVYREK